MQTQFDFETVSSWTLLSDLKQAIENRWIKYEYQLPMVKAMVRELSQRAQSCSETNCQTCKETKEILNQTIVVLA